MHRMRLALCALVVMGLGIAPASAQSYPTRSIRLVVPFGAGGGTDNLARIIEPLVSKALGQPMVIENKPGGGSIIGMDAVAKAAPDGYTLVMTDTSIAVNPGLKALPYVDVVGISVRLDNVITAVDTLPLAMETRPPEQASADAAAARVLRTSSTRASWRMPRNTGTSTARTSTKSTTAAPRLPRARTVSS